MRWLIVEDALQDHLGHWYEYVRTFRHGLLALGDHVDVLASRKAEGFILDSLQAAAVLPPSIWHRMSDQAPAWQRYLRVPAHAWSTWRCVRHWLQGHADYDLIFVPTVSAHHLLGWHGLIHGLRKKRRTRVLLYFISLPLEKADDGSAQWIESPTKHLFEWLFRRLGPAVKSGRVLLGVETGPLKRAVERLTGLPVQYLAQPVESFAGSHRPAAADLLMACYGGARCEKGSELLQSAIARYLERFPHGKTRFAVQWVADFRNAKGEWVKIDPSLARNERVQFIRNYFAEGEYGRWLARTQVILLPYQSTSYDLRGSRVAIEAMIHGIPAVITRGTAVAEQAEQFGAAVLCEDGNEESLVNAIHDAEQNFPALRARAQQQKAAARAHFSVAEFRRHLQRPRPA